MYLLYTYHYYSSREVGSISAIKIFLAGTNFGQINAMIKSAFVDNLTLTDIMGLRNFWIMNDKIRKYQFIENHIYQNHISNYQKNFNDYDEWWLQFILSLFYYVVLKHVINVIWYNTSQASCQHLRIWSFCH